MTPVQQDAREEVGGRAVGRAQPLRLERAPHLALGARPRGGRSRLERHQRVAAVQGLFRRGAVRAARRIYGDPRFTQLRPNLEEFREIYTEMLAERDDRIAGGLLPLRSVRYLRPAKLYYRYVEEQLAEVERMLALLDARNAVGTAP